MVKNSEKIKTLKAQFSDQEETCSVPYMNSLKGGGDL